MFSFDPELLTFSLWERKIKGNSQDIFCKNMGLERFRGGNSFLTFGIARELVFCTVVPIVAGSFLGRFADQAFSTDPIFLLFGVFFGIFLGTYCVYKKTVAMIRLFESDTRQSTSLRNGK